MTEISKYDIEIRNEYLEEARSLDFLNAVFCIYFYNTDVKRWGPNPKPYDITAHEVFGEFDSKEFDLALKKCMQLLGSGLNLGDLALSSKSVTPEYLQAREEYSRNNSGFNSRNLARAFNSGMRDMR